MTAAVAATADVAVLATADDYLGLTAEQRYNVVSQHFPSWLLTEPIEFPAHHSTYGWACRVDGCDGVLPATHTRLLCNRHATQFHRADDSTSLDEFVRDADPGRTRRVDQVGAMTETPAEKAAAKAPAEKAAAKAPATRNFTPETPNFTPDVEAAAERIKQTSERVLALSKENGLIWLDAYEKMLDGVLKLEEDTAKDLGSDWVEKLVSTQADFIRDTSQAYLSALRDRLK